MNRMFLILTLSAACLVALPASALEPPVQIVESTNFIAWRNSIHSETFATRSGELVDFAFLIEQPRGDLRWNVYLDIREGTNRIAHASVGYQTRRPAFTQHLKSKRLKNKTIQQFEFTVNAAALTNSDVTLNLLDTAIDFGSGTAGMSYQVRLIDIYNAPPSR